MTPEERARETIDELLQSADWTVQDRHTMNLFDPYFPRVAVSVDIATGTDVRAIEILRFVRQVRSRGYFEQMRGRGTQVISSGELQAVTADAHFKTHFVFVDAVSLTETEKIDPPLAQERKRSVPFKQLIESVAYGTCDLDTGSSLASRWSRMQHNLTADDKRLIADLTGGGTLHDIIQRLLAALETAECSGKSVQNIQRRAAQVARPHHQIYRPKFAYAQR